MVSDIFQTDYRSATGRQSQLWLLSQIQDVGFRRFQRTEALPNRALYVRNVLYSLPDLVHLSIRSPRRQPQLSCKS